MRIVPLEQNSLLDLKVFFAKVRNDFLPTKKKVKTVPIDKYLINTEHKMLIAIQGSFIVGFIAYNNKQNKIVNMAVLPDLRNKGVGTELMKRALLNLRDGKKVTARTWESNIASIKLLEQSGFKKYKTVKNDRVNNEATFWFKHQ